MRTYNYKNILEMYNLKDINQLLDYIRKNKKYITLNLSFANLSFANLIGTNLSFVDLENANLRGTDLSNVNLSFANLNKANLRGADLRGADLSNANIIGTNLNFANISYANLYNADLDYSTLHFSCKSLRAKFDQKHIIQILYHAAIPTQINKLKLDNDIIELFNSELFNNVVNRFHRIGIDCNKFKGVKNGN